MSTRAGYFRLGLFIVATVSAGVALLLVLGIGALFQPKMMMETYFDESVQGLEVGSPVKLRGVTIGEVSEITFTYAHYQQDRPVAERDHYVMVRAWLRPDLLSTPETPAGEGLERFVERGLRVRMTAQGVTGMNFLELDYLDAKGAEPIRVSWEPEHIYVPSAPSTMTQFLQYADNIMRRVNRLDVESILTHFDEFLVHLNTMAEELDDQDLGRQLGDTLGRLDQLLIRVQSLADSPELARIPEDLGVAAHNLREFSEDPQLQDAVADMASTLETLERTLGRTDALMAAQEEDVAVTLDNLRRITDELRAFTEDLRRHPGMIWSREPDPREPAR
ncbi:paraquat-inducible protein B [Ectothiorhodospira mobilis]|uniref:Paraquat-inducible protein B n=1 Tax=Ectothiorhodospira mobilis TaxID=195064 RepID=A0A1I4QDY5_ECTMO|nr:MlaD family protein [Ectothiorhodospira mobilis]SFM37870.1 paraquat-inducible protein B [Ectothiorhodospira mobilis]